MDFQLAERYAIDFYQHSMVIPTSVHNRLRRSVPCHVGLYRIIECLYRVV